MSLYNSAYAIAVNESRQVWRQHHLGTPSDNVVDIVQDRTWDAMRREEVKAPAFYGAAVARNEAAHLAHREHIQERMNEALKGEFIRLQQSKIAMEELVDMRLQIERMVIVAREMPISDRLLIARLVNDETKKEDSNAMRRVKKELGRC
jgi:hypothetical protein